MPRDQTQRDWQFPLRYRQSIESASRALKRLGKRLRDEEEDSYDDHYRDHRYDHSDDERYCDDSYEEDSEYAAKFESSDDAELRYEEEDSYDDHYRDHPRYDDERYYDDSYEEDSEYAAGELQSSDDDADRRADPVDNTHSATSRQSKLLAAKRSLEKTTPPKKTKESHPSQDNTNTHQQQLRTHTSPPPSHDSIKDIEEDVRSTKEDVRSMKEELKAIKKSVDEILELLKSGSASTETAVDPQHIINGVNAMEIPTRDCYSYALDLMTMHFTREELSRSLIYQSSRSKKPALEKAKVDQIMLLVKKKFGKPNDPPIDQKLLLRKMNQKCLDSASMMRMRKKIRKINEDGNGEEPNSPCSSLTGDQREYQSITSQ